MTAMANINGKEIEVFVHEIIRKDGASMAIVNKGQSRRNGDWWSRLYSHSNA